MNIPFFNVSLFVISLFFVLNEGLSAQEAYPFVPVNSSEELVYPYAEDQFVEVDHSKGGKGYWMFYTEDADLKKAPLICFIHGYGGYNPMIYGEWIKHLVRQGNIVIYPRYQLNVVFPRPNRFAENTQIGILDAMQYMREKFGRTDFSEADYVGHSYGGVIISDILTRHDAMGLPRPKNALLCAPGTSRLSGGRLDDYGAIDPSVRMLIVEEGKDWVVGQEFSRKVFKESSPEMSKRLLVNYQQILYNKRIRAHHNECYSVDESLDSGLRNYTASRAFEVGETDLIDFNLYWRLFDLLRLNNEKASAVLFAAEAFDIGSFQGEKAGMIRIIEATD